MMKSHYLIRVQIEMNKIVKYIVEHGANIMKMVKKSLIIIFVGSSN